MPYAYHPLVGYHARWAFVYSLSFISPCGFDDDPPLPHPDLMIQTAGCQQGVVFHQLSVSGEQQLLTLLHAQLSADSCMDKPSNHSIGFYEVLIAGRM